MSDINVIQEATEPPQSLSNLNIPKVSIYLQKVKEILIISCVDAVFSQYSSWLISSKV